MSRNVTILIIILVIILLAGYLVWLRGKFQASIRNTTITPTPTEIIALPTRVPTPIATVSAIVSPSVTVASKKSPTVTPRTATRSGTVR